MLEAARAAVLHCRCCCSSARAAVFVAAACRRRTFLALFPFERPPLLHLHPHHFPIPHTHTLNLHILQETPTRHPPPPAAAAAAPAAPAAAAPPLPPPFANSDLHVGHRGSRMLSLQKIDMQTEQMKPVSMTRLWQKQEAR